MYKQKKKEVLEQSLLVQI